MTNNIIWNETIDEAFLNYAVSNNASEKNKIYNKYLHLAFKSLIISTVKKCKVKHGEEIYDDLLSILIINIQHFKPKDNTKINAYAYCSTIIRSAISDYKLKRFRDSKNITLDDLTECV